MNATPRGRRHSLTRERILEKARKILVSQGLRGLSMRALAEAADYSAAAIYKYFANKEAILQSIREEGWVLAAKIQEKKCQGANTVPERLVASGLGYLEFAAVFPEHYHLMFNSPDLQPRCMGDIRDDPNFSPLIKLIESGVKEGSLRLPKGFDPLMLAVMIWTSVHGIAMIRVNMLRGPRAEFDVLVEKIVKTFVYSLRGK